MDMVGSLSSPGTFLPLSEEMTILGTVVEVYPANVRKAVLGA